jgi:hypothetical protein
LVKANPSWKRPRLSKELCVLWNWRAANGQMKNMACRAFLLTLEQGGYITLSPPQRSPDNSLRNRAIPYVSNQRTAINGSLDARGASADAAGQASGEARGSVPNFNSEGERFFQMSRSISKSLPEWEKEARRSREL